MRRKTWRTRLRQDRSLLIMTLPAVALLVVFAYVPMLGNVMAFQQYSPYTGFFRSAFVGFDNFVRVFANPLFLNAV
ncbi:MAG TPA: sugar ABC transporter permease, partial [Microlunatus sp.]|nr:sugar ABC transporter permease [Microlunatus sp.]